MATLVRTQGSHKGKWVYTVGTRCALGRHADCDIADIFAENNGASRYHAVVELVDGGYVVEDSGSRNGTYVNGKRISGRTPLRNGDRLGIAGVELTFQDDAASTPVAGPATLVTFDEASTLRKPLSTAAVTQPSVALSPPGYSADKLRALVHMLKRLSGALDIKTTLHELLDGLFAIFPQAESGFVAFTVEGQEDVTPRATHFRHPDDDQRVGLSRTLIRHVLSRREAVLWADKSPGAVQSGTLESLEIRSLMCAPLLDGDGTPFGVVQIDTQRLNGQFTAEDLEVMVGAVSQASVAVRFAKLHEEAMRSQAVARDLELARRVQLGLLPVGYPKWEGFEFFAYYRAAYDVGGDYYDFIELPNQRLALVVADAAGKGVSAALMMAKLSGELKYYLSCDAPANALARLNDSMCGGERGRFVTLLAAILDRPSLTVTLINAGHPVPLRRRADGSVETVGESIRGLALGLMPGRQYKETTVPVEPGDLWLAYTDGFTEATSRPGKMFGLAQLRERFAAAPPVLGQTGDRIVRDVLTFQGDQPQGDDMCLIGWGMLKSASAGSPGIDEDSCETTKLGR